MWQLEKKKGIAVYKQIVQLVLTNIQTGFLRPGERLPAERKLAALLQVNRSTLVHALDELEGMGILIRKRGNGTFVQEGKWGVLTGARAHWENDPQYAHFDFSSQYQTRIEESLQRKDSALLDAYTGELPLDLVPSFELPKISWKQVLQEEAKQDELGYLPLRQAVKDWLWCENQLALPVEEILITSGAQQALFLILQILLQAGDAIAIEEPSSFYSLALFQALGIRVYGVPLDHEGMKVTALEDLMMKHKIKMVLVNPSYQNPTGIEMSARRRQALIQLCSKQQVPIMEDAAFAQLSFPSTTILPSLKQLDPENVCYIGSLSKILGSTTKIGWLSAPASLLRQIAKARKEMDFTPSVFPQMLAFHALNQKNFYQKLATIRLTLLQRYQRFIDYLESELPNFFTYQSVQGGYFLWLNLKQRTLGHADFEKLLQQGLAVAPSEIFGMKQGGFRLNFSCFATEKECQKSVRILKNVFWP